MCPERTEKAHLTQSWRAEGLLDEGTLYRDVKDKQSQAKEGVGGQRNEGKGLGEGAACGRT